MREETSSASVRSGDVAPALGGRRGLARWSGLALLAAGLTAVAAVADAEAARDLVIVAAVVVALAAILLRLRRPAASVAPVPPVDADSEARAHFLALAAHEIRTPLTGIVGLADLLGETVLSAEQETYLRALRSSGASLLRLVDGYLDLTRLEAGGGEPNPVATSLEAVVEEVVELVAPSAQGKGLEIAAWVSPAVAGPVFVDPLLLRQVLINLVGNAVKFTERGGVAVEIERAGEGDGVLFRVRDTGIGIDPDAAERIFEEWQRADGVVASSREGSGLGLAIARGIVDGMGGEIALSSRPGHGSVFSFVLDLPVAGPRAEIGRPLRGRRIAIVSRASIEPPLLVRRLHALGAEAWLTEGAAALVGADRFDAVLVDGHDGPDPVAVLEDLRGAGIAAPAVVLVEPAGRAALPRFRANGFSAHLVRPVRAASLARVVAIAADVAPSSAAPVERAAASAPAASVGLDVLLVDDNEINVLLGRAGLEHAGHRVVVAEDGDAALAEIVRAGDAGRSFAVVLMDLHMPGRDGFSVIRALRAAETAEGSRALVVALTADGTPAAAERAVAAGADAVMVKPIDRDRLAELVARRAADCRRAG